MPQMPKMQELKPLNLKPNQNALGDFINKPDEFSELLTIEYHLDNFGNIVEESTYSLSNGKTWKHADYVYIVDNPWEREGSKTGVDYFKYSRPYTYSSTYFENQKKVEYQDGKTTIEFYNAGGGEIITDAGYYNIDNLTQEKGLVKVTVDGKLKTFNLNSTEESQLLYEKKFPYKLLKVEVEPGMYNDSQYRRRWIGWNSVLYQDEPHSGYGSVLYPGPGLDEVLTIERRGFYYNFWVPADRNTLRNIVEYNPSKKYPFGARGIIFSDIIVKEYNRTYTDYGQRPEYYPSVRPVVLKSLVPEDWENCLTAKTLTYIDNGEIKTKRVPVDPIREIPAPPEMPRLDCGDGYPKDGPLGWELIAYHDISSYYFDYNLWEWQVKADARKVFARAPRECEPGPKPNKHPEDLYCPGGCARSEIYEYPDCWVDDGNFGWKSTCTKRAEVCVECKPEEQPPKPEVPEIKSLECKPDENSVKHYKWVITDYTYSEHSKRWEPQYTRKEIVAECVKAPTVTIRQKPAVQRAPEGAECKAGCARFATVYYTADWIWKDDRWEAQEKSARICVECYPEERPKVPAKPESLECPNGCLRQELKEYVIGYVLEDNEWKAQTAKGYFCVECYEPKDIPAKPEVPELYEELKCKTCKTQERISEIFDYSWDAKTTTWKPEFYFRDVCVECLEPLDDAGKPDVPEVPKGLICSDGAVCSKSETVTYVKDYVKTKQGWKEVPGEKTVCVECSEKPEVQEPAGLDCSEGCARSEIVTYSEYSWNGSEWQEVKAEKEVCVECKEENIPEKPQIPPYELPKRPEVKDRECLVHETVKIITDFTWNGSAWKPVITEKEICVEYSEPETFKVLWPKTSRTSATDSILDSIETDLVHTGTWQSPKWPKC